MKKIWRIAIIVSFILNIGAVLVLGFEFLGVGSWVYRHVITPFGASHPVKRHVGWVIDEEWTATDLKASFVHEKFGLFNSYTAIKIDGELKVKNDKMWSKVIEYLFVSHRYEKEGEKYIAVIEVIPKFESVESEQHPEVNTHKIRLKEKVQNRNWGPNYYRVFFGNKSVNLETFQRK